MSNLRKYAGISPINRFAGTERRRWVCEALNGVTPTTLFAMLVVSVR